MSFDFETLPPRPQEAINQIPFDRWLTTDGGIVALFFRTPEGFLLRFPGRADFALTRKDFRVTCTPVLEASQQQIADLFYNQIVPLIHHGRNKLVLHASAVAGPVGVLAFLGHSGQGKSTLAASLAMLSHPFLTDDGLLLEPAGLGYAVTPNRPYLRLWSDSANAVIGSALATADSDEVGKTLVDAGQSLPFQDHPLPLHIAYLLGPGTSETAVIERLNPAQALSELIKHSFILDVDDRQRLHAHFDRVVRLAETITCFTLDYPRRYEELPKVIDAILAHANSGDPAA